LRLALHGFLGPVDAGSVLGIHGFLDHGRSFRRAAEHLTDDRLIAIDNRGHGRSDWIGAGGYYHFYDYYADLAAVFDRYSDRTFGLVGHSMGGSIATAVAALFPDRVRWLLLLEGMGPPAHDLHDSVGRLKRWLTSTRLRHDGPPEMRRNQRTVLADVREAAARLRRTNVRLSEDHALELAQSFTEPVNGGVAWAFDPLHRTPGAKPFQLDEAKAIWRGIRCPVLSLMGEHGFRPPDLSDRHRHLARAVLGEVPDSGHNIHHDRPDVVAEAIRTLDAGRLELPARCRSSAAD
jgi:pimeloyl-ACP methyl ester carboxylesterase